MCSRSDEALQHLECRLSPNTLPCEAVDWTINNMPGPGQTWPGFDPLPDTGRMLPKSANRMELALYAGRTVLVNGRLPSLDQALREEVIEIDARLEEAWITAGKQGSTAARRYLDRKQLLIDQQWCELIR